MAAQIDSDVDSDPEDVLSSDSEDDVGTHDVDKPVEYSYARPATHVAL